MELKIKTYKIILISLFMLLSIFSYLRKSATFDEIQHLSSGYAMLKEGRLDIGVGHPPLFRLYQALPLLLLNPDYPKEHEIFNREYTDNPLTWSFHPDYNFGFRFLFDSDNNAALILFLTRLMAVFLAAFLALGVYSFSKELFGPQAALFSMFLYSFSPTIMAHARLIVNDLPGAAGIFFTIYALYRYWKNNSIKNLLILASCFALAMLIKFNAIILLPFIFLYIIAKDRRYFIWKFALFIIVVSFLINLTYGFNGTFSLKSLDYNVISKIVPFSAFDSFAAKIYAYIPLPDFYMKSLSHLFAKNAFGGHSSFVLGEYSGTGWWYYFPLVFLVKTPVVTLLLTAVLIYLVFRTKKISSGELLLLLFCIFYGILSVKSKINIGHRHILPLYPFLFVMLGKVYVSGEYFFKKQYVKYGLPILYLISTQIYFPHYLAYFNSFVSPDNGYKYFVDSNIDWGQDLPALKQFQRGHKNSSLILSYFGSSSRNYYGIKHQELFNYTMHNEKSIYINPVDVEQEFLAVSVTNLQGVYIGPQLFNWLKEKKPVEKLGYSIYIYDISTDIKASAIIAQLYMIKKQYSHARRQYQRVVYLAKRDPVNKKAGAWAMDQLAALTEK